MTDKKEIFFTGNSMLPTIKPGCRLMVEPVDLRDIDIGDIIVFDPDRPVCHRVLGKYRIGKSFYFLERGDNSGTKMLNSIPADKIIGKVTEIETFEGGAMPLCRYFSRIVRIRLIGLSFIFGAFHHAKRLLLGNERNSITRGVRFLLSRLYPA